MGEQEHPKKNKINTNTNKRNFAIFDVNNNPSKSLPPRWRFLCGSCDALSPARFRGPYIVFRLYFFTFVDDDDGLSMIVALSAAVAIVEVHVSSVAA